MSLSEATLAKESALLRDIDSMQNPSNSDLNPLVTFLLNHRFYDWQGHPEAGRLVRAAIRLRGRFSQATSSVAKDFYGNQSLSFWMNFQLSRYTNN